MNLNKLSTILTRYLIIILLGLALVSLILVFQAKNASDLINSNAILWLITAGFGISLIIGLLMMIVGLVGYFISSIYHPLQKRKRIPTHWLRIGLKGFILTAVTFSLFIILNVVSSLFLPPQFQFVIPQL